MMKFRVLWLLLVVPLIGACQGGGAEAQKVEKPEPIPLSAGYNPPIQLTTVSFRFPHTKYRAGEDENNNIWTRSIATRYGIQVKTLWQSSEADFIRKTNQLIASGNIPDFFPATAQQLVQLTEAGMLEDMTQVYKDHAPDSVKKVVESSSMNAMRAATIDGRLMGIPWTGTDPEKPIILWIRKDWKDRLGLPDPRSVRDMYDISEAFAWRDPDGNGIRDTYGLAMDKNLHLALGLMNGFHVQVDMWVKDGDGKLVYSETRPQMKEALLMLREMYAAGHFDPTFVVKSMDSVYENIGSGQIGMIYGNRGFANFPLAVLTPEEEWVPFEVPTVDGTPYFAQLPATNAFKGYYWVVRKGVSHPEAIFTLMDFFLQTYYYNDSEEVYYQYIVPSPVDSTGIWTYAPVKMYMPDNNIENYRQMNDVFNGLLSPERLAPERKKVYERLMLYLNGQKSLWSEMAQTGPNGSASIIDRIIKENRFIANEFYSVPTPTMAERNVLLKRKRDESFLRIVTGELPPDAFDTFVSEWKREGGAVITQEVNDWYNRQR